MVSQTKSKSQLVRKPKHGNAIKKLQALKQKRAMNDKLSNKSDFDIKDLFNDNKSDNDIIKELFASNDIKTKTEVSDKEISIISRLYFIADYTRNKQLNNLLQNFLELKLSRKRESRKEFMEGIKNLPRDNLNGGDLV